MRRRRNERRWKDGERRGKSEGEKKREMRKRRGRYVGEERERDR